MDPTNLGLKVTLEPLLDAGPLLPAQLLPQLTLVDTGPLDLQYQWDHIFCVRGNMIVVYMNMILQFVILQNIRLELEKDLPVVSGVVGSGRRDDVLPDDGDICRSFSPPPNLWQTKFPKRK